MKSRFFKKIVKLSIVLILSLMLSGCMLFYRSPNYRFTDSAGKPAGRVYFATLETDAKELIYKINFTIGFEYSNGKIQDYPEKRDFYIIKEINKNPDKSQFDKPYPYSSYGCRPVDNFRIKGHFELKKEENIIELFDENKKELMVLKGKVFKKYPLGSSGSGKIKTIIIYNVIRTSIPEFQNLNFYGTSRLLVAG